MLENFERPANIPELTKVILPARSITLWSIQPKEFAENLTIKGLLRADSSKIDQDFARAYAWIKEKLCAKVGEPPEPGNTPLWCWYQYDGEVHARPDLRRGGHLPRGTEGVRIEFEIDPSKVLLSDFTSWHCVLNGNYLPYNEIDQLEFDQVLLKRGISLSESLDNLPTDLQEKVQKSWERIFDLNLADEYVTQPRERKSIQAILWEIELKSVRSLQSFRAR